MTRFRNRIAALSLAAAALPAAAGPYTDLWWSPAESGWGMNVVQQGGTAFVTLFVYGPDGQPTWYVASEANVLMISEPGGLPVFHGRLYRTRGPWHGGPFDPGAVEVSPVGSLTLETLGRDRLRLHYNAEGVSGVRELTRQSVASVLVAPHYSAQFVLRVSPESGAPIGVHRYQGEVEADFTGGAGWMRVRDSLGGVCEYRGPYQQTGKLLRFTGTYACTSQASGAGTFEVTDLEVSTHGITGHIVKTGPGLVQRGRFAAARY